ncbi:hypothetical protein BJX62DRAFT_211861 [Aspergillus germanicus]
MFEKANLDSPFFPCPCLNSKITTWVNTKLHFGKDDASPCLSWTKAVLCMRWKPPIQESWCRRLTSTSLDLQPELKEHRRRSRGFLH